LQCAPGSFIRRNLFGCLSSSSPGLPASLVRSPLRTSQLWGTKSSGYNDFCSHFFGREASTDWNRRWLEARFPKQYAHYNVDIRDTAAISNIFEQYGKRISLVIHTAAQPSHDWATSDPQMDFSVNANGTLCLLEATRKFAPAAPFIFTSTNKVYGDTPNLLPLRECATRREIAADHPFFEGIDETMSIDQSKHSVFGASKVAADVPVQEYGRYFSIPTVVFRGGCLTGPNHSGPGFTDSSHTS
jgi:CDP-paratose 2-epimerase